MAVVSPGVKKARATFGPTPRKYTQVLPKTMRHAALRSALSQRVREEAFTAVSEVKLDGFKTKTVVDMLKSLTQDDHSVSTSHTLLLIAEQDAVVMKSAANIPGVEVIVAERINVVDVVNSKRILATKDAITKLEEVLS